MCSTGNSHAVRPQHLYIKLHAADYNDSPLDSSIPGTRIINTRRRPPIPPYSGFETKSDTMVDYTRLYIRDVIGHRLYELPKTEEDWALWVADM